jgi:hypothetical protein
MARLLFAIHWIFLVLFLHSWPCAFADTTPQQVHLSLTGLDFSSFLFSPVVVFFFFFYRYLSDVTRNFQECQLKWW